MQVGIAKRALFNDPHCGDECAYWQIGGKTILCVVDGLGHGPDAEAAGKAAVDYVGRHLSDDLPDIFGSCDLALRRTRGVAMGIAVIHEEKGTLTYAGVGNTRAMIVRWHDPEPGDGKTCQLSGNWGIVGSGYRKLSFEIVPLKRGDLVVLYTDGLKEVIDMSRYDDACRADVRRLADKILRDWGREMDDGAVLVYRSETT